MTTGTLCPMCGLPWSAVDHRCDTGQWRARVEARIEALEAKAPNENGRCAAIYSPVDGAPSMRCDLRVGHSLAHGHDLGNEFMQTWSDAAPAPVSREELAKALRDAGDVIETFHQPSGALKRARALLARAKAERGK